MLKSTEHEPQGATMTTGKRKYSPLFWLTIMFEFFERGSYYGMMSVLSVYFTDVLMFQKESVGIIKSTIQPLLYFLPIITGALADRFGYRKMLTIAFSFLGIGYFFTARATSYGLVFIALVVMAIGAGTFKPIISGSIAKLTDEENSSEAFGIYYWSINLGAFLFPLFLVPFLKNNIGWQWVFYASALGTGAMLIPTALFFKEPPLPEEVAAKQKTHNLKDTIAHSFEIIYSPIVLVYRQLKAGKLFLPALFFILTISMLGLGLKSYISGNVLTLSESSYPVQKNGSMFYFTIDRDMTRPDLFQPAKDGVTVYKPEKPELLDKLDTFLVQFNRNEIEAALKKASTPTLLTFHRSAGNGIRLAEPAPRDFHIYVGNNVDIAGTVKQLKSGSFLHPFPEEKLRSFLKDARNRPFPLLFVGLLLTVAFLILMLKDKEHANRKTSTFLLLFIVAVCVGIPDLTLFARILSFAIFATVLSLFTIETRDTEPFIDHFRFLLLIFIYSGFWVMYFQMFDSVLWYVKAYVDSTPLNAMVNQVLAMVRIHINWYFDVEHVTVINALTIIVLQLFVTKLVKHRKALPTMISGILFGTIGMALLAVSTGIWVFLIGIIVFSIGEMTAHPKFISYVGQTAPKDKVAMYMGYLFLYGVIGSSIGGVLGANLYVHFVDHLHQPRILWIIFTMIGAATIVGLALYNRFFPVRKMEG